MDALSTDRMLALVDTAYAASEGEIDWIDALTTLTSELGMRACSMASRGAADPASVRVVHSSPEDFAVYTRDWADSDLRAKAFHHRARALPGHLFEDSELISLPEWHRSDTYNGFFRPRRQESAWSLGLTDATGDAFSFVLTQPTGAKQPDPAARRQIRHLGGHFIRAFRIHDRYRRDQKRTESLVDMVERIGRGAMILDRRARVDFASPRAITLLGDRARVSRGVLTFSDLGHQKSLDHLLATSFGALGEGGETGAMLTDSNGDAALMIRVVPMRGGRPTEGQHAEEALVMIWDPKLLPRTEPGIHHFAQFDLTPAEIRLAGLVGAAMTPSEAADLLGIRVATARSSLSIIYSKLGISRQSELVAMVSRLA